MIEIVAAVGLGCGHAKERNLKTTRARRDKLLVRLRRPAARCPGRLL